MSTTETSLDDRMRAQFEGAFLDATDIKGTGDITLEIASVSAPGDERDAAKKVIDRAIIGFKGAKKRLICNKTNAKIIAQQHGKKASAWIGKSIKLTVRYLKKAFGQNNVPVIRVVPASEADMTFGMRKNYGAARPFDDPERGE